MTSAYEPRFDAHGKLFNISYLRSCVHQKSLIHTRSAPLDHLEKTIDHTIEDPEVIIILVQAGGKPNCPDHTIVHLSVIKKEIEWKRFKLSWPLGKAVISFYPKTV